MAVHYIYAYIVRYSIIEKLRYLVDEGSRSEMIITRELITSLRVDAKDRIEADDSDNSGGDIIISSSGIEW